MGNKQLTTTKTCLQKRTYLTNDAAKRAVKRRNKAAGYKYLRRYQCDNCSLWHVTSQVKVIDLEPSDLEASKTVNSEPQTEATQERKDISDD